MNILSYKKIGTGYPLVLIHGYLGGQSMWKFQEEELKNYYDLIMPSLAGYGESSHMIAPSTIEENANQVFELLDFLKIDKFNLLGHSMGGMIVQEMAAVNQTVMLSLAMVVVASLIGAKGLGQDVLEALQYANVGQGILAGIAILFCALILDRIIQGKKRV